MESCSVLKTSNVYGHRAKTLNRNNAYCFRLLLITVIGGVLIHLFAHYSDGFLANYFYILVEMAVITHCFILGRLRIKAKYFCIIVALILVQTIASFIDIARDNSASIDFHKIILFFAMYFVYYVHAQSIECTNDKIFEKVASFSVGFAFLAVIVNFIMNSDYILSGNLESIMLRGSHLISFFSSRAYYAFVLIVGVFSALYCIQTRKKHHGLYIVLCVLLAANVVMTGARTQIIELVCAFFVYTLLNRKQKILWLIFVAIVGVVILSYLWQPLQSFIDRYSLLFTHDSSASDISTGRFTLWAAAFQNSDMLNWLIGHGFGSKDVFLFGNNVTVRGGLYGSFHSGYVDMFFEAGLVGLVFIITIAVGIIKNVLKYFPKNTKVFFLSLYFAWFIECLTGAGFMFFTWDLMAIYSSFMFVFLPLFLTGYYKKSTTFGLESLQKGGTA